MTNFELYPAEQSIHQEYLDYFGILQTMKDNNLNPCQLDSVSVAGLTSIMESGLPLISAYARGMLVQGNHIDYTESVSFSDEEKSYPAYNYLVPGKSKFNDQENLVLFPNPAGDYVIAYVNTIDKGKTGIIILNDIKGKQLGKFYLESEQNQVILNLSAYPEGIYLVSLFVDDQLIETHKLSKGR